jgi:phosphoadenosine phosphosulfate reductase
MGKQGIKNTVFDAEKPNREQADRLNAEAVGRDALDRLRLVVELFGTQVIAATSFSAEDQVLTHMLSLLGNPIELFTIDTGRLPQETFDVMEQTQQRYGLNIRVFFPDYRSVEAMTAQNGPNPFYKSVELRKQCCQIRKVEPLRRALSGKAAWVVGLRRSQSITRQELTVIQHDEQFGLFKVCPLADWTEEQVWEYIASYNIPYNKLHDAGYPSIGCGPCTRAVEPGQDVRAGRWWWEEPEHKECGLHWDRKNSKH